MNLQGQAQACKLTYKAKCARKCASELVYCKIKREEDLEAKSIRYVNDTRRRENSESRDQRVTVGVYKESGSSA